MNNVTTSATFLACLSLGFATLQSVLAIRELIALYKEHWQLVVWHMEPIRRRNRYVIGFEWGLVWIFLFIWAIGGEEFYFYLALLSSVCFGVAVVFQLAIKYLYHLRPKN